jgi:predicted nucleic acid-binding protein
MKTVFADTIFFVAAANQRDSLHIQARRLSAEFDGQIVTSQWVLTEVANYFARSKNRDAVTIFIDDLLIDPKVECISVSATWFEIGWQLYRQRTDKEWSLTDCISFEIMRQQSISDAWTWDHHFEQAGFSILMR